MADKLRILLDTPNPFDVKPDPLHDRLVKKPKTDKPVKAEGLK